MPWPGEEDGELGVFAVAFAHQDGAFAVLASGGRAGPFSGRWRRWRWGMSMAGRTRPDGASEPGLPWPALPPKKRAMLSIERVPPAALPRFHLCWTQASWIGGGLGLGGHPGSDKGLGGAVLLRAAAIAAAAVWRASAGLPGFRLRSCSAGRRSRCWPGAGLRRSRAPTVALRVAGSGPGRIGGARPPRFSINWLGTSSRKREGMLISGASLP